MLEALGLTADEESAYLWLCDRGTVDQLSLCGTPVGGTPADIVNMLEALHRHGLIQPVESTGQAWRVRPIARALFDLLVAQGREIAAGWQSLLEEPGLDHPGSEHPNSVVAALYPDCGVEVFEAWLARARSEICSCESPHWISVGNAYTTNQTEIDLLRRGVAFRVVYDHSATQDPQRLQPIESGILEGEQARTSRVPVQFSLNDAGEAWVSIHDDLPSRALIPDSPLSDVLRLYFETVWQDALPISLNGPEARLWDRQRRVLLRLLASGLTQASIADHLGQHPRTTQHHVHALMLDLDARTMFQAGYQAVQRGWLTTAAQGVRPTQSPETTDRIMGNKLPLQAILKPGPRLSRDTTNERSLHAARKPRPTTAPALSEVVVQADPFRPGQHAQSSIDQLRRARKATASAATQIEEFLIDRLRAARQHSEYEHFRTIPSTDDTAAVLANLYGSASHLRWAGPLPGLEPAQANAFCHDALRRGVATYFLFSSPVAGRPEWLDYITDLIKLGFQARAVRQSLIPTCVVDRRCVVLPRSRDASDGFVVVTAPAVVVAIDDLLERLWQHAVPVSGQSRILDDRIDSRDPTIESMLLAGLTDDAIARQLHTSRRTVQRRVAAIMALLQATNRFQAGVQLALQETR